MKIEQRSSGCFRVRKTYKGKTYTLNFDHKPSQKEVTMALAEKFNENDVYISGTFEDKANEYIKVKSNILSPSTIGGYEKVLRCISDEFKEPCFNLCNSLLL